MTARSGVVEIRLYQQPQVYAQSVAFHRSRCSMANPSMTNPSRANADKLMTI